MRMAPDAMCGRVKSDEKRREALRATRRDTRSFFGKIALRPRLAAPGTPGAPGTGAQRIPVQKVEGDVN